MKKVFQKIYFYIHFLSPSFGAPGPQNDLKLKLYVYINELYNSLKNGNLCMSFKKVCKGHLKKKKILRHPTLYQTSVKGSQGIILCTFRREIRNWSFSWLWWLHNSFDSVFYFHLLSHIQKSCKGDMLVNSRFLWVNVRCRWKWENFWKFHYCNIFLASFRDMNYLP